MRKLLLTGVLMSVIALKANAWYVIPANIDTAGTFRMHFYGKGYVIDQGTTTTAYWQKDIAFIYGIQWVPANRLELGCNPPLLRYHFGRGPCYAMGFGDMDITMKYEFIKGIAVQGLVRVPTGAQDLPVWDNLCPKFSANKVGCDMRIAFSQSFADIISAHINIGWINNIGNGGGSKVPENRFPLGIGFTFPLGLFVEGTTDVNPYEDIGIDKTPKRVVTGIEFENRDIKYLFAVEYGTWGTGDPAMHPWHWGWNEDVTLWDIILGISLPISFPKAPPKIVAGIVEGKLIDKATYSPVKGIISIKKLGLNAITDDYGRYKLILPKGHYTIVLSMPGYESQAQGVEVVSGETKQVDFLLAPVVK